MVRYFLDSTFDVDSNGAYTLNLIRKGTVTNETSLAYEIVCNGKKHTVMKSITATTFKEAEDILTSQYSNWGDEKYSYDDEVKNVRKGNWRDGL